MQNQNKALQRYVHFEQYIHKTHSQHIKKSKATLESF